MKRRQALRTIILSSIGVTLLPSCDFESFKTYENLPLEKKQYRLIRELQSLILPKKEINLESMDTSLDYLLSRISECYEMKDIQKYLTGLSEFELYISERIEQKFHKLLPEEQLEIISKNLNLDAEGSAISYFLQTNKNLTVEHFTRSKYFLTTHLDYEFMPGRYDGCASI